QPSHRIIILSARASIYMSKLRTLRAAAVASGAMEAHNEHIGAYTGEPDTADCVMETTTSEIANCLEEASVIAKSLGLLPLSNFAAMCQLVEGGFPGATAL